MTPTQQPKKGRGRPITRVPLSGVTSPIIHNSFEAFPQPETKEDTTMAKVGHFIVVNTPTIKGIRLNLEKVRTYAKAGQEATVVTVAWDNGTSSGYTFGSEKDAYDFLALLDEHCL